MFGTLFTVVVFLTLSNNKTVLTIAEKRNTNANLTLRNIKFATVSGPRPVWQLFVYKTNVFNLIKILRCFTYS